MRARKAEKEDVLKEKGREGRSFREDWRLLVRGYQVMYEVCPQKLIWNTICCITERITPFFTLFLSAKIISRLAEQAPYQELLRLALITVAGQLMLNLWSHFCNKKKEET